MWNPDSYTIAAQLLPRLLGLIYFFAIGAFLLQIKGLLGKNGILPISDYLDYFRRRLNYKRFYYLPSLFWFNSSDRMLVGVILLGIAISTILMLGYFPTLCLATLFIIHLSIVSTGQDFLSFGWESFLLEITFYTFLVSLTPIPNLMTWINLNFLLFRFHFQAGIVKFQSGDPAWRNMTGAAFHYQSQPLPNMWAWYAYKWPLIIHKGSTIFMFFAELIVPFGLFFTDDARALSGVFLLILQLAFWLTGNFSYLNHLTAVFCIIAFNNSFFSYLMTPSTASPTSWLTDQLLSIIGTIFLALQCFRLWHHFQYDNHLLGRLLSWFSPFHLVNRYGLFAIMTKKRIEIIIEGSDDGEIWKEYLCWFKPSELNRRPRRISPIQPRLDWQMWFLPFEDFDSASWFRLFLAHLLQGTPEVLKLLRYNPFPTHPPKFVRTQMYDYRFSTSQQKKELGLWWQREFVGPYGPIMKIRS